MIYIENNQEKIEIEEEITKKIEEIIDFTLKEEKVLIPYEISLIYVDNSEIKKINAKTRNIDKETDVLSFPMLHYPNKKVFKEVFCDKKFSQVDLDDGFLVLGDIVLSLEKAKEQANEFSHSFTRECCYLVIHSVLHLLGYDHMEDAEKHEMRKVEEEVLERFSIKREVL